MVNVVLYLHLELPNLALAMFWTKCGFFFKKKMYIFLIEYWHNSGVLRSSIMGIFLWLASQCPSGYQNGEVLVFWKHCIQSQSKKPRINLMMSNPCLVIFFKKKNGTTWFVLPFPSLIIISLLSIVVSLLIA